MITHRAVLWIIAFSVLCAFLASGLLYLAIRPPRGQPVELLPAPSPAPILVHAAGAFTRPGLYQLPSGSRIRDLLEQAGGLAAGANEQALNLAAPLQDGDQVFVPTCVPTPTPKPTRSPSSDRSPAVQLSPQATSRPTLVPGQLININTASLEELDMLPGIGPALAQRIIDYRNAHGPFKTIEEIQNVSGIGPVVFDRLRLLITVGGE